MNSCPLQGREGLTGRTFTVQANGRERSKGQGKTFAPLSLARGSPLGELCLYVSRVNSNCDELSILEVPEGCAASRDVLHRWPSEVEG